MYESGVNPASQIDPRSTPPCYTPMPARWAF